VADDEEEIDYENYSEGPFDPKIETPLVALGESFEKYWKAFSAGRPDLLWHYTNADGFQGIVTNGTFRFSHARLLNDTTEVALGWQRVTEELEAEIARQVHLEEFYTMTKVVATSVHSNYHYFVFSLSAREDSLSQWRAYGSGGAGYSLGFATGKLDQKRTDGEFFLVKLEYDEKQHRKIIRAAIKRTRAFFNEMNRLNPPKQHQLGIIHRANVFLSQYLMRVSLLAKDASFEDEKEWRMVVGYSPQGGTTDAKMLKKTSYRAGGGLVRPYHDLDFRYEGEDPDRILPLRKVWYGPTLRPKSTELSIRFVLDQKGYPGVTIRKSDVPLET
jgi:hypothetical protein